MKTARDRIPGKRENRAQIYHAQCYLSGWGKWGSFDPIKNCLEWRALGICSFRWREKSGEVRTGKHWREGILLFSAGIFSLDEIRICLNLLQK